MATKVLTELSSAPVRPDDRPSAELEYTVLPVSALKKQHAVVFNTLRAGKTVYVANRGRVVAAFRPASFVPEAVAASHTSPYVARPTVNARDLGRGSVSKAVDDARQGLVSIVVKDGSIYGILTPATTPEPPHTPDMDAIGAKAEAMRQWRADHPDATTAEMVAYSRSLGPAPGVKLAPAADDVQDPQWSADDGFAAIAELQHWKDIGSDVEDAVREIILEFTAADSPWTGLGRLLDVVRGVVARGEHTPDTGGATAQFAVAPTRAAILSAEMDEAAGRVVQARRKYVEALSRDRRAYVGAAFALANLAWAEENRREAAVWYRMAFQPNAVGLA